MRLFFLLSLLCLLPQPAHAAQTIIAGNLFLLFIPLALVLVWAAVIIWIIVGIIYRKEDTEAKRLGQRLRRGAFLVVLLALSMPVLGSPVARDYEWIYAMLLSGASAKTYKDIQPDDVDSIGRLGDRYASPDSSGNDNLAEAAKWYHKAADCDSPRYMAALASLYFSGNGVKKDIVEGCFWDVLSYERADTWSYHRKNYFSYHGMTDAQGEAILKRVKKWKPAPETTCREYIREKEAIQARHGRYFP